MRYLVRFPEGIPAYSSRHGRYVWEPGKKPVTLLHNDWDMFWVKRGAASWDFRDGKRLAAGRDQLALLPPFVPALLSETRPQLVFLYFHFNFRMLLSQIAGDQKPDFFGPGVEIPLPLTFSAKEAPGVARAYAAIGRLDVQDGGAPWRLERATITLVAELAEFAKKRARSGAAGTLIEPSVHVDPRVAAVCAKVDAEPARPWRVTALAGDAGLSAGRLHNLCRRVTGYSLKGYIVRARLLHALKLLKEPPHGRLASIKEVSAACGFSSQHFFSRQFKSHFRITPLAYRSGAALA